MIIDLSCPAELFQTALPTEDIPAASLVLFNLSDRVIVSAEVTLKLLTGSGVEKDRVVYRARALNGRPHSTFSMTVPCSPAAGARQADVTIDKVWFNDNAVWRRDAANSVEYTSNALPVSRGLTDLRFVAGETAVGWPSQQDGLWVCVCGRPNADKEEFCARCRRQKNMVFACYNREAVEKQVYQRERQLELSTRSAREDTARLQRIREEEYNEKMLRKGRRRRLAFCFAAVLALAAGMYFGGLPALRMLAAGGAMGRHDYAGAMEIYADLGSFPGAEKGRTDSEWEAARETALKSKETEALAEAAAILRRSPDREDSLAVAEKADVLRATLLLNEGDPDGARKALELLDKEDKRRITVENACLLAEAKSLLAEKEYDKAREAFLVLTDNEEAAELAQECVYLPAGEKMAEEMWDEALAMYAKIPDYRDSRDRAKECHYRKAERFEEEGDLASAAAEYLLADDYSDAADKTLATVYAQAEEALQEGNTESAMTLYASVPGYADADAKKNACRYALALAAMDAEEYERALELFSGLPENYEQRASLLPKAAYRAGLSARNRKDWESTIAFMTAAGDYEDAEKKKQEAVEKRAAQLLDEGKGEEAAELIARIPDSKNYNSLKKKADYLIAVTLAEAEDADAQDCLRRFRELGKYEDAEVWTQKMLYRLAEEAAERGETLEAAGLYVQAGNWEDAAEKAEEMYDDYFGGTAENARAAAEEGNYALAVALLEILQRDQLPEKYKDLAGLYEDACLEAGKALFDAGKPYEAKAFFDRIPDNRRAKNYLGKTVYLLLGTWVNRAGDKIAEFREDGTCEIAGEKFIFQVPDSYTLKTAPAEGGDPAVSHRISNLTTTRLTLRDMRSGHDKTWNLFRPGEE